MQPNYHMPLQVNREREAIKLRRLLWLCLVMTVPEKMELYILVSLTEVNE